MSSESLSRSSDAHAVLDEAHHWRARIDDGGLNHQEQAAFASWMAEDPHHAAAFAESEILWKSLASVDFDARLEGGSISQGIAGRIAQVWRDFGTADAPISQGLVRLAFGLVLAVGLAFLMMREDSLVSDAVQTVTLQTGKGETRTIELADGSELVLSPGSTVDVTFREEERSAQLLFGTAYFDVASNPDAPFRVMVGAARVEVTGTAFELQRRGNALSVSVAEGAVRVSHPRVIESGKEAPGKSPWVREGAALLNAVVLHPGDSVVADQVHGLGEVKSVDVEGIGAWRRGQLIYVNAPLAMVVADLNRYASFKIEVDEQAAALELSGTFSTQQPEVLLSALDAALPVNIINEGSIQRIEFVK
ncbi:MAG: FecR domain-containing protein [Pseudomonadota bacterium]